MAGRVNAAQFRPNCDRCRVVHGGQPSGTLLAPTPHTGLCLLSRFPPTRSLRPFSGSVPGDTGQQAGHAGPRGAHGSPPHIHSTQAGPQEADLTAAAAPTTPAAAFLSLLDAHFLLPTHPAALGGDLGKDILQMSQTGMGSSEGLLGSRLRPPPRGHALGDPFLLCTCLGMTFTESFTVPLWASGFSGNRNPCLACLPG